MLIDLITHLSLKIVQEGTSKGDLTQTNAKNQFPSMVNFHSNLGNNEMMLGQKSKPFTMKKRSSQFTPGFSQGNEFDPFENTLGQESLKAQGSILKRRNSQRDSEAFGEFKSDEFYNTHNSKSFGLSRRYISHLIWLILIL